MLFQMEGARVRVVEELSTRILNDPRAHDLRSKEVHIPPLLSRYFELLYLGQHVVVSYTVERLVEFWEHASVWPRS